RALSPFLPKSKIAPSAGLMICTFGVHPPSANVRKLGAATYFICPYMCTSWCCKLFGSVPDYFMTGFMFNTDQIITDG
ncbi:MAG: hypothetical protein NTX06_06180, partial [Proteobacteria bacterium]|nr:hypothetical protein [Pseudomonadota bacterium]